MGEYFPLLRSILRLEAHAAPYQTHLMHFGGLLTNNSRELRLQGFVYVHSQSIRHQTVTRPSGC